ncbi:Uroporphyrinogen-III C-methyltransferase [Maioricimonas rarisocia]|uniref:uroporphyrinogen-III C-methyltransferase n=1 Tax=Maioricimonas rarisocia TaxID=2528026 RepID=A0A517Z8N1_9PLAN|nr:uroporphyrinogen-III C-methyltransferase [Maioricimonas rarisocia]QDU38809.1 Uroporphyrinogen-III C-methyltransferase [Maioricimonas rarisocia]
MNTKQVGKVYLVGAGPGDPGLLTLKGLRCLQEADHVLYDGLVNPILLRHTSANAERTARTGRGAGRHLDQEEINRQLIAAAQEGKTVVRLKGGDPFIFGRGSEEAAALAEAGIPYEIVPGITAATAAGEYAGISLTHRAHASAVAFITGHEDPSKPKSALDYEVLARFPGTLVFYMGLHQLPRLASALIAAGKSADTPAAVVSRATTPHQRTVEAPLGDLPTAVKEAGVPAPSLIIIGDCVEHRRQIAWFENRPLLGRRVGVTRPEHQAAPQINRLFELGAEPVLLPAIQILPPESWDEIDAALETLDHYDWIVFTSANGVASLLDRLWERGGDIRALGYARTAAIGSATADAMRERHLQPDLVPDEFRAEALADALAPHVAGKRVLWARANRGRDVLPNELRAAGAHLDELVVYRNLDIEQLPEEAVEAITEGRLDWIGLSSPSIAHSLSGLLPATAREQLGTSVRLAAISPVTAEAAKEEGLPVAAVAAEFTWDGIFDAIVEAEREAPTGGTS